MAATTNPGAGDTVTVIGTVTDTFTVTDTGTDTGTVANRDIITVTVTVIAPA